MLNNFNQSSTGINLSLDFGRDEDLARTYFNEEIINIRRGETSIINFRYSRVDLWLIGDLEYDIYNIENYKYTKKQLLNVCNDGNIVDNHESKQYFNKLLHNCNKNELKELISDFLESDQLLDLFMTNLYPLFNIVSIRGYSQGDYTEIIIPPNLGYKVTEEYLTNLFYDQPFYCDLSIDNEDNSFRFYDYLNSLYNYDKKELLEIADREIENDKKEIIMAFLKENLPDRINS
jgi:hypothetical protein